jgi:hypothetical protein
MAVFNVQEEKMILDELYQQLHLVLDTDDEKFDAERYEQLQNQIAEKEKNINQYLSIIANLLFVANHHIEVDDDEDDEFTAATTASLESYKPISQQSSLDLKTCKKVPSDFECQICKDTDSSIEAIQLPCMHSFHLECITPWFSSHNDCPYIGPCSRCEAKY